jgi:hypothetical protein
VIRLQPCTTPWNGLGSGSPTPVWVDSCHTPWHVAARSLHAWIGGGGSTPASHAISCGSWALSYVTGGELDCLCDKRGLGLSM